MDFALTESQKMIQTTARKFVEEECLPVEQEMLRKNPDFIELPKDIFNHLRSKAKEIGLWALDVPLEYGGQGLDLQSYCLVTEELAKTIIGSMHYTPLWSYHTPILFPALYRGSDYQKKKYLYPVINGDKIPCLANTEPEAGSDAAAIKTTAVKDGDDWIVYGNKRFATFGNRADFFYVSAVTDKTKGRYGITMFLVDADTPGIKVERVIPVLRPDPTTEVVFENCRIHDRQRLDGSGWGVIQEDLDKMRLLMAAACLGHCDRSLNTAIDYVQGRITFGQPLSNRQAIQFMLADSALEIHLTRLMALEVAWKIEQGMDVRQETAMTKLYAAEMAFRTIDNCIQCLGGIGLTKDSPIERWWREVRVLRIGEGPSEIMRWIIARNLFKGWRP